MLTGKRALEAMYTARETYEGFLTTLRCVRNDGGVLN
jgi:hypothetical protein